MKKYVIGIMLLMLSTQAFPAGEGIYNNSVVLVKLKQVDDHMEFDVPFKVYSWNVYYNNQDISHSWHNRYDLDGVEVMALLGYKVEDQKVVDKLPGNMGWKWKDIQKNEKYTSKFKVKKEDALATYSDIGVKTSYDGADKDELVKFCQWEEC